MQEVSSGAGRGSFNSLPVEFGLGRASAIRRIRIRWPSGIVQTLDEAPMDRYLAVKEPLQVQIERVDADGEQALEITWDAGVLQEAPRPEGPWSDLEGASNAYRVIPNVDHKLYRTRFARP